MGLEIRRCHRGWRRLLSAKRSATASQSGSIVLELLVASFVIGLAATTLLGAMLGSARAATRAGQMTSATAIGQAVIEELRLWRFDQIKADAGLQTWCPPDCPTGFSRVEYLVDIPADAPAGLKRVTVTIYRTGEERPAAQVVSYLHER